MKLTPLAKTIIAISLVVAAFFSFRHFAPDLYEKLIPGAKVKEAVVPPRVDLPGVGEGSITPAGFTAPSRLPGTEPGCTQLPEVRALIWAWNAQMGLLIANGGPQATSGSLMCQSQVNLKLIREDDVVKMQESLVTFATELSRGNAHPKKGAHFVAIMGDGSATFLKGINDALGRLGPEYTAKVIGSAGYSRGEDKFMGPPEWKANPVASRGGVVAGVLRDGDWNIAQKWLGDNGLCSNPDEHTFDPNCLNWVAANDYIDAAEKYVANYCENRPVVSRGKKTGESKKVCVGGVVTWTPGDVTVAQKRGGLVSVVSTREYSSQMPNVLIGIDKWMKDNRPTVEGMLSAVFDGGNWVRANKAALQHAARVSATVYNEAGTDAAYWEKYFQGAVEKDKQGLPVELGGSSVNNLADNLLLFGLVPGSANLFAATYTVFGDIVVSQYPDLVPSYPPVAAILDTSYVEALAKRASTDMVQAEMPTFSAASRVDSVVSRKSWHINFETGKATFTPAAESELKQLLRDLLVASAAAVEVHGHTDSVGSRDSNQTLSESRAFAVKSWLEKQSPVNFPEGRIRVFAHGQENPVAPNTTDEGRAKNRRVEIVIGTTSRQGPG